MTFLNKISSRYFSLILLSSCLLAFFIPEPGSNISWSILFFLFIIIFASILTGYLAVLFKMPLLVLLLVGVFLGANYYLVALMAISLSVALIMMPVLSRVSSK